MKAVVRELADIAEELPWPREHLMTMKSRRTYETGLDIVNSYRGHPDIFLDAFDVFQATGSTPYAYAGIAFTLAVAAAQEDRLKATRYGLEKAMYWLEKSQNLEPDRVEINFIEAVIYLNGKNLNDGRTILSYLDQPNNYHVCVTEVNYWSRQGDRQQQYQWLQQAAKVANNRRRQAFVLNSLANFYLDNKLYEKSIKTFQKVLSLDPEDPWAWHNMSVIFVRTKHFKEADHCNKQALSIMDFEAARQIEQTIKEKRGIFGRLLGT